MTRIYALLCAMALVGLSCSTLNPFLKPIENCAGKSVAVSDANEALADLLTQNWGDLAAEGVRIGFDVLDCIIADITNQAPALKPAAKEFKTLHAVEFRAAGVSACRSPGESMPPEGPMAAAVKAGASSVIDIDTSSASNVIPLQTGDIALTAAPPDLLVVAERSKARAAEQTGCGPGMRDVTPMAPGVVCLRDGVTFTDVLCRMKSEEAKPYPFTAKFSGSGNPWAEAVIDLMHALPATACRTPSKKERAIPGDGLPGAGPAVGGAQRVPAAGPIGYQRWFGGDSAWVATR